MKILISTDKPFAPAAVQGIREVVEAANMELQLLEKYSEKSQLMEAIATVDGVIVRSDILDAEVLAAAKNLKVVVRAGAGYDNVDLAAATAQNICVMNTPGQNSNAVAELVFGMAVMMARKSYSGSAGTELKGKSIGIHAFGQVGRNVARIAQGFGMQVFAFDPYCPDEAMVAAGVTPCASAEEMYSQCGYISLHIPATAETKQSINGKLLGLMPAGAVLINTARKEVINEEELVALMESRSDFCYISDIQPTNAATFAEKLAGRYFFTPKKMGAQTAEANINAGIAAAKQSVAFLTSGDDKFRVNR